MLLAIGETSPNLIPVVVFVPEVPVPTREIFSPLIAEVPDVAVFVTE